MTGADSEQTLKDQGNDMFRKGDYLKAAAVYTKAIKEQPTAVLYRCATAAALARHLYLSLLDLSRRDT